MSALVAMTAPPAEPEWLRAVKRRRVAFVSAGAQPCEPQPALPRAIPACAPITVGAEEGGSVLAAVPGAVDAAGASVRGEELVLAHWLASAGPWAADAPPRRVLQLAGGGLAAIALGAALLKPEPELRVVLAAGQVDGLRGSQQPLRLLRTHARLNRAALPADALRVCALPTAAELCARPTPLLPPLDSTTQFGWSGPWALHSGRATAGRATAGRLHGPGSRSPATPRPSLRRRSQGPQREPMTTGWIRHQRWRQLHEGQEEATPLLPADEPPFDLVLAA